MNKSMKFLAVGATSIGLLVGCSSSTDYDFEASKLAQQKSVLLTAEFDPSAGKLPFPNDLLFSGTEDGTLNIPVDPTGPEGFSNPVNALNTIDGFSTTEPVVANFSQNADGLRVTLLDASSVALGESVRFFEVTLGDQGQVNGIVEELGASQVAAQVIPTDPTVSANGSSIAIVPLQPLKQRTSYMAMITSGVKSDQGAALGRGSVFGVLASGAAQSDPAAAGLQGLILSMLGTGAAAGVTADDVILAWSFTTQSITPVFESLKNAASSRIIQIDTPLGETGALSPASPNLANIFAGRMQVPYYLAQPSAENPVAAINSFFNNASGSFLTPGDNTPISTGDVDIPVLFTKPKGTVPDGGFPIAIFQHGITRNRTDMLALADAMASAGFAMIAIDIPVHGVTPDQTDFALFRQPDIERHFEMDLVDNGTRAPGADGNVDASGTHFYNLSNLLNTRDNTRQAVADLFTLSASLGSIDDIDSSRKVFIGHSLGAIIGTTFLAFDDTVQRATLSSGGGGLPRLLAASPAFGPAIAQGLSAVGVDIAGASGNAFLNAAQTVVDSADPINHAAQVGANSVIVHMTQVNGDTVVINSLAGFPLVGTEALARNMGLSNVTETTLGNGLVKFEPGYHSSLLSPAVDETNTLVTITAEQAQAVYLELQRQTAAFASSGTILIQDPSVIAVPAE